MIKRDIQPERGKGKTEIMRKIEKRELERERERDLKY